MALRETLFFESVSSSLNPMKLAMSSPASEVALDDLPRASPPSPADFETWSSCVAFPSLGPPASAGVDGARAGGRGGCDDGCETASSASSEDVATKLPSPASQPQPFDSPLTTGSDRKGSGDELLCTPTHSDRIPYYSLDNSPISSPVGGRKDWRRTFVERATKANRKLEYLDGSHCRETHELNEVMEEAVQALEEGVKPDLVEDGLGGTYFIKDRRGRVIAVFKPRDEEPLAPNNPKHHTGQGQSAGLKEGILVGEAAINEYAAFIVDHASSASLQAGVPPTALVRVCHSVFHLAEEDRHSVFRKIKDKVGSFQLFAPHDCTSEDHGPSRFPVEGAHRIAVLDIRLCNTDRHSGNILVREDGRAGVSELVPIDHGYALPSEIGDATFEWLSWPASKQPFSDVMRAEILAIDVDQVEASLKKRIKVLRPECLQTLRICTRLLQIGVEAGLTAYEIGSLMVRSDGYGDDELVPPSALEELVVEARIAANGGAENVLIGLDQLFRERCQSIVAGR